MNIPFRILHVDDSPFDRQLVRDVLEMENDQFAVITATSRQEFENRLSTDSFDLVLTDFNILGFEGLQVIDSVHDTLPSVPVIVLTGTGSEEVAVEAMKRGAADYVIKNPHHIRRLPMAIQSAIERRHLRDERLRSEQALRASEERLRAFANALPDLAFIMDETGRYVQLLSASEHLLYSEGERYLGKLVDEVLPELIANQIKGAIRMAVKTGTIQTLEYQLELSAGQTWFEGRFSLMADVAGEQSLVVYVARDITDSKYAEIKLTQERNLLRTLIDNAPDYIYVINQSGQFIASNIAHAAAAHLLPSQIIGKSAKAVFSPELAHQFHSDDVTVIAGGSPLINEERLVKDVYGNQQWVLITKVPLHTEHGDITGLVGIARDITFRKRAEEALQESEEYLQAVVAGTPVILFVLDTEGKLSLLQGHGLSAFPDNLEVLVGHSILEALEAVIPDVRERFQQALKGEETSSIQTIGDVILDVRYSPMRNKAGEISGIIGVATDITERLKTERLKIELEKEQEIIALKERFIATASHDFRTPLAVMKMSATMLERYYDRYTPEERQVSLDQINAQIDRMIRLLDDVLTMSKANAGKLDFNPQTVVLKLFCEQIWDNFRHMVEETHKLELVYSCNQARVILDPDLVHYILVNLLSNAVKYSPVNGYIRFEVLCDSTRVIFRVSDNGIGIPKKDQAKLFEPFHRAANTGEIEGTGLGLSIVKNYVEIHQGNIVFESEEGRGTTFTVNIPLVFG